MLRVAISDDDLTKLLTNPKESYIIDIDSYIPALKKLTPKLNNIEGLYLQNSYKPLIEFNSIYYVKTEDSFKLITHADDIKTTKSDIYIKVNNNFELHYRYSVLKKNINKLTVTPDLNYIHILLIKELTDTIINSFLNYKVYHHTYRLYNCFKPQYQDYVREELFQDDFNELYEDISNFIFKDRWSIYFTKIINNSILIEKTADYRIYQWTLSQLEVKEHDE